MKPDPLTPHDLDLRDFDWMPLDVKRLRDSDLAVLAPGDAFRAAVLLWCAAWHQVPAASLPKEERLLANFAGYGRDMRGWGIVRDDALRGFIECSDGRLYHPVVAQKALEANEQRNAKRKRTEKATEARRGGRRNDQRDDQRDDNTHDGRSDVHHTSDLTLPSEAKASDIPARDFFEEFWKEYPSRDGDNPKLPAKIKFDALVKTGIDPELIIAGARRYAAKAREKGQAGTQYIAHALKWLNDQRWADIAAVSYVAAERAEQSPKDWDAAVKRWISNESLWPRWAGSSPGSTACRCPAEILIANGIDPDSGAKISRLVPIHAGTDEMAALVADRQARNMRPPKVYTVEADGREQTLCWAETRWPRGFNDFGERMPAKEEDAA